jgi:hypothetical protein
MTEGQYRDDPEPSGPHHETGQYPIVRPEMQRETRIPAWAVTSGAIVCMTAALIAWGEVRFVLRTQFEDQLRLLAREQAYRVEQMHILEEKIQKHEDRSVDRERDYQDLRERFVRIEERLDAIAAKLGVGQNGNGSRRQ